MRATARLTAIAVLVVAALTGCVRLTADTRVNDDDTFTQVAIIATTPQARTQLTSMTDVDLGDLKALVTSSDGYLQLTRDHPDQVTVEDYADGDLTGVKITATNLPLAEFASSFAQVTAQFPFAGEASLTHTGDTYVVSIPAGELADGLKQAGISAGQLELLGGSIDVALTFSFPGLVESATVGTVDGKTVTLGLADLASGKDITIVAGAAQQMNWQPWLMWGGIGLALLVIVGGATALIVQDVRRHRASALPRPDATAGSAPSGPGVIITTEDAPEATDDDESA